MIGPIITYELAKTVHDSRLEEAEQARLLSSLKAVASPPKPKKQLKSFTTGDGPTTQPGKIRRLITLCSILFRRRLHKRG